MKKIIIFSAFWGLLALSSCEPNMDYANPVADVAETYYNTKEHFIAAVNGEYGVLQSLNLWGRDIPYILNGRSDEGIFTSGAAAGDPGTAQMAAYTVNAGHAACASAFADFYTLQHTTNVVIENLLKNTDGVFDLSNAADKALYDRLLGESYFLRGFSRFYLISLWGDAIIDRDYVSPGGDDYYKNPEEKGVIYQKMIQDFKDAEDLLPLRSVLYADASNAGRATKGSAQAMLAKAYMGRPILDGTAGAGSAEWDEAKTVLKRIIDSNEYDLVNNYRDNNSEENENNIESVFEVQFVKSLDAMSFPGDFVGAGECSWRQIGMTVPSAVGFWWNIQPSLTLYNEFERDGAGNIIDSRAFQGLWVPDGAKFRDNGTWVDYTTLVPEPAWQGKHFGTRKNGTDYNGYNLQSGGANDRIIRYADVLLMYAECCIETGDNATALQYINMVRSRANNQMISPTEADAHMFYATGTGSLPTAEQIIAAAPVLGQLEDAVGTVLVPGTQINTVRRLLKHEYSVELFMEGWRFFNVMRWHNNPNDPDSDEVLSPYINKYKTQQEQTSLTGTVPFDYNKHALLPIPSSELSNNPNLKPNSAN
jgi:hypothetical protein